MIKKYFLILSAVVLIICNNTFAQQIPRPGRFCDDIILEVPLYNNQEFNSKKKIYLKEGFSYSAGDNNKFSAAYDPTQICEISNESLVEGYSESNPYEHNKSLPVGSISGQAAVSPSGAATYEIPIFVSPGTAGMQPGVSIVYNSQSGDGLLGKGWHISGISNISLAPNVYYLDGFNESIKFKYDERVRKHVVTGDYKTRYSQDGKRLIIVSGNDYGDINSEYRTEIDNFNKIVYTGDYFIDSSKNGYVSYYGSCNNSKLRVGPSYADEMVMTWFLDKITDNNGNYIKYEYYDVNDFREKPIKRILYTGNEATGLEPYNEIEFCYTIRPDKNIIRVCSTFYNKELLLEKIIIKHNGEIKKEYLFKYTIDPYSKLSEIIEKDENNNQLNSTIIEWGEKDYSLRLTENENLINIFRDHKGENTIPLIGDFNGDGLTDWAFFRRNYNKNDERILGESSLYWIENNYNEDSIIIHRRIVFDESDTIRHKYNVFSGDIDYDGREEFIFSSLNDTILFFYHINENFSTEDRYHTEYIPGNMFTKQYISGNFSGNGKPGFLEYIVDPDFSGMSLKKMDETGTGHELSTRAVRNPFDRNAFIMDYNKHRNSQKQNIDFDGDGTSEILGINLLNQNMAEIHEFNEEERKFKLVLGSIDIIDKNKYTDSCEYYYKFADFNGDGKTDIMTRSSTRSRDWRVHYSSGIHFTSEFTFTSSLDPLGYNKYYKLYTVDMNGDGTADIVEYMVYKNGNVTTDSVFVHINTGHGKFDTYKYSINRIVTTDIYYNTIDLIFSDFNGDGKTDILFHGATFYWAIAYFMENDESDNVKRITNGFNIKSEFDYGSLIRHNAENNLTGAEPSGNITRMLSHMSVVDNFRQTSGIDGIMSEITYKYIDGKVDVSGRGFLGFKEVQTFNNTTNTVKKTWKNFHNKYSIVTNQIDSVYINGTLVSGQESSYTVRQISNNSDPNHIVVFPSYVTSIDYTLHHSNFTTTNYVYYDQFAGNFLGNLRFTETSYSGMYRTKTEYFDYVSTGSWCKYLPGRIVENRTQTGGEEDFTLKKNISYDDRGNPERIITYSNTISDNQAITEIYTYDRNGNVINVKTRGIADENNTMQERQIWYTYDNEKRFILTIADILGKTKKYTYDPFYGNVMTYEDPLTNATIYRYDGFGNLKKIISPSGIITEIEQNWMTDMQDNLAYYIKIDKPNAPSSTVWYDILGREVKSQSKSHSRYRVKETIYRADGLTDKETLPYFAIEPVIKYTQYEYDEIYRLQKTSSLGRNTYYSYNSGERRTSFPDGTYVTQKMNAAGQLTSVESVHGNISYTYHSNGNPLRINAEGAVSQIEYDTYGNQKSLSDVNAGKVQYKYNAFGELIKQIDENQNTFILNYDNAGRLISKICTNDPDFSINYEYNSQGLLSKESMGNGNYKSYAYDNYGNIINFNEKIGGSFYKYTYEYDEYQNLIKTTYPSGFTIENEYNNHGILCAVSDNSGNTIWKQSSSDALNEMGQILKYTLGPNNINVAYNYNENFELVRAKKGSVFDYSYSFNHLSGNLDTLKNNLLNLQEIFKYDDLNRLVSWKNSTSSEVNTMRYDVKGNIESKSDIGSYTYDNEKIHAVSKISHYENSPLKNSNQQLLEYNPFHRPEKIIDEGNGLRYEIVYGTGSERKITYNYRNDELQTTKYYSGLYEKEIMKKDGSREFHFIPGGDGIAAVHIINNGNAGSGITYYFVNDHLGSVIALIDKDQNIIEEHSYDPWGNPRNHRDWSFDNVNTSFLTGRGYTFHEMLPQFGLINMNARLYDPVTARVLSPDNYVQSPLNAQNYNRYSYCFNNPLKYNDPTGNKIEVVKDEYGFSYGPHGRIDNFGEIFGKSPWYTNNSLSTGSSGVSIVIKFIEHAADIDVGPLCDQNEEEKSSETGHKSEKYWTIELVPTYFSKSTNAEIERLTQIIDNSGIKDALLNGNGIPRWLGNTLSAANSSAGYFQAAYLVNANRTFKYAQRINGTVRSANTLTRANRINSLSTSKSISRVGGGLTALSLFVTAYDGATNDRGWQNHHTADMILTGALYGTALAVPIVGWIAGGVYFVADVTTQYYTGKSITENLFD